MKKKKLYNNVNKNPIATFNAVELTTVNVRGRGGLGQSSAQD